MHADQHVARGAEVLHLRLVPRLLEHAADAVDVGRLLRNLHHRAAGELDREVQAARGEEEHRQEEGERPR